MYAVHMESMEQPELGPLADRTAWSGIPPEDLFRLLKLANHGDGLDVNAEDIIGGHRRTIVYERLLAAAYALGHAAGLETMGNPVLDDVELAWEHAENPR